MKLQGLEIGEKTQELVLHSLKVYQYGKLNPRNPKARSLSPTPYKTTHLKVYQYEEWQGPREQESFIRINLHGGAVSGAAR